MNYDELNVDQIKKIIDRLGGMQGVEDFLSDKTVLFPVAHDVINKLGGSQRTKELLSGNRSMDVVHSDSEHPKTVEDSADLENSDDLTVEDATEEIPEETESIEELPPGTLFDGSGRCIPSDYIDSTLITNPRPKLIFSDSKHSILRKPQEMAHLGQFKQAIGHLHKSLEIDTGITGKQFQTETKRLLNLVQGNDKIANIAKSSWWPVILPKIISDDLGEELESYLLAIDHYHNESGKSSIRNYNDQPESLLGCVHSALGSRHEKLVEQMKQGPVMGLYFANSLEGFSCEAAREQESTLPEGFILSGLDIAVAIIMYPSILINNGGFYGLTMSALSQAPDGGHAFNFFYQEATKLAFDIEYYTENCEHGTSPGLLFIG